MNYDRLKRRHIDTTSNADLLAEGIITQEQADRVCAECPSPIEGVETEAEVWHDRKRNRRSYKSLRSGVGSYYQHHLAEPQY
jgi:hypothetical protein